MSEFLNVLQQVGVGLGFFVVFLACVTGIILSCVSLSGTWVVTGATILAVFLSGSEFPGWKTVMVYLVVSILVEVLEALAGTWGVQKRGGSKWAGFAALAGGLIGLFAGSLIPIAIVGNLIGMFVGSFLLVYLVENRRLKVSGDAAHIASGAVIAKVLMILVKVGITLGMAAVLFMGIFFY